MKTKILAFLILMLFAYNCIAQNARADLKKLTWIEGNWKGMDGNNPFYEIYKIKNDSTLVITSYEWNGKDSSKSSVSILWRKDGYDYLGDSLNWKVTDISEGSIFMEPVYKASNTIRWKKRDQNTWEAILESKRGKKIYVMERVNHFPGK